MELLSKITMKHIGCQPKPKSVQHATVLATIYGLARDAKVANSTYGDYVKFSGTFEAINIASGEMYTAGTLILPKVIEGLLQTAVIADADQNGAGVQFAIEVGVKPSEAGNTGYEWTVKPLVKTVQNDALQSLRDQLAALPAPEAEKKHGKK